MPETQALTAQPAFAEPIAVDHAVIVSNNVPLTTHTGFQFHVRPVEASDKQARAEFFKHASREDLRSYFLSSVPAVRADLLNDLVNVDHGLREEYLALDINNNTIVASVILEVCADTSYVEVSIVVRGDYKHRGMSFTLLNHVIAQTCQIGTETRLSTENRQKDGVIRLRRK